MHASFWARRSARERRILAGGGILVALLLGYGWLWRPVQADLVRMEEQLPRLRAQAQQIEAIGTELAKLRTRPPAGVVAPSQLSPTLSRSAADAGLLHGSFIVEPGEQRVKARFDRVGFNAWAAWVDQLHRSHRLVLVAARIDALPAQGLVRIECEFSPAAETR